MLVFPGLDVGDLERIVGVTLHLLRDRYDDERPDCVTRGSSSMVGYSGAQCAGGSSWVPSWSVLSIYSVASKPCLWYVLSSPFLANPSRSAPALAGEKVDSAKPTHTGILGVMVWVRSTYFALFNAVS